MAGSRKWMLYRSDNGQDYAVQIDESNGEAGGFTDVPAVAAQQQLPKGMKMRHVLVKHAASGASRKLYLGTPTNPLKNGGSVNLLLFGATTATLVPFNVSKYNGETSSIVFGEDTAQQDGDAS